MSHDTEHIPRRGDLYIIEQRTKDKDRTWKWFGVVLEVKLLRRAMEVYRLGDYPRTLTVPTYISGTKVTARWGEDYPSITYVPDDQWPDGCIVLKMKAVLCGDLPEDLI